MPSILRGRRESSAGPRPAASRLFSTHALELTSLPEPAPRQISARQARGATRYERSLEYEYLIDAVSASFLLNHPVEIQNIGRDHGIANKRSHPPGRQKLIDGPENERGGKQQAL